MANVLIMGSGGREHALGWKLKQSKDVTEIYYAPGNAGTAKDGTNVALGSQQKDFPAVYDFIASQGIDLVVVGPEQPLVDGITDYLYGKGYFAVFGPTANAARLESDKFFSYNVMKELDIPQARGVPCYSIDDAKQAIQQFDNGVVLKARGLTGGKGVSVFNDKKAALDALLGHASEYGNEILVSEKLCGEEFSVFALCDGRKVMPIYLSAQDHKPLLDGDKGPNTGGMGAYSPAPVADARMVERVKDMVLAPLVDYMKSQGMPYKGFLYAGMMMTRDGPKVLEFNVRFGDPECQPIMPGIDSGLYEEITDAVYGRLANNPVHSNLEYDVGASCCVVLAMPGYPKGYQKGLPISGLEDVAAMRNVKVFHAGTKEQDGVILTSGGRVLGVTARSVTIKTAKALAYEAAAKISIPGGFHYRKDIADKALRYYR